MNTNPSSARGVFDLPLGQRTPITVPYLGLEYPGEVVLAPAWEPALGEPLQGDRFFRIVFLQTHVQIDPQELQDARTAVCLPPRSDRQRERALEIERRVLRELRTRYTVPESERALQETQRQLYASGTLVTRASLGLRPQDVFQGSSSEAWLSSLGQALLAWTYPRLPLDSSSFPRPLTAQDAGLLFRGLVGSDSTPEVTSAVAAFGPGLGLLPGAQEVQVLRMLRDEMAQRGGAWPCAELYQRMAHIYGMPYPLISLFLLMFVHRAQPPVELHLRSRHGLRLQDGRGYSGWVVLAETVAGLDFVPRLDMEGQQLRYATPASWNTISLYFSTLEPSLASEEQEGDQALAQRLMETLKNLQSDVHQVERGMDRLAGALGEEIPRESAELVARFRRLSRARTAEDALQRARQLFGSPQGMAQSISHYRPLRQAAGMSSLLATTARYLQQAHVPEELRSLSLQRQTLQAMLHMSELTTSFSAQAIQGQIQRFREEYQQVYEVSHDAYHRTVAALLSRLREAKADADALERLNTISELGEPVETEALDQFQSLMASVAPCPRPSNKLPLGRAPQCRTCGLVLGQQPPSQEVGSAVQGIQRGLREQSRQLSLLVVQRVLRGPIDSHIARFISMVQASNVAGLVQVLDDQIVAFLREVLKGP